MDDYYYEKAEKHIEELEDTIYELQVQNNEYRFEIIQLEQEIDALRAQIQDLTHYLE